jgi:hypothetical protein
VAEKAAKLLKHFSIWKPGAGQLIKSSRARILLRVRSRLQPQIFTPLKVGALVDGEICVRVFRRCKLAQFATSLLANYPFWLVVPLRQNAARAIQPDIERKRNVVKDQVLAILTFGPLFGRAPPRLRVGCWFFIV